MIVFRKYQYCSECGQKLEIIDNGEKQTEEGNVHEYILRCPNYIVGQPEGKHSIYIYSDPVE